MRNARHIRFLGLALAMAASLFSRAQSAEQFTLWGDRAMAQGDHNSASRYYSEALAVQPGIQLLQWKYAEACRQSNQYREAALYYDKVQAKDYGRRYPEALRWLAEMQMSQGHYDEAARTWAKTRQKERKKDSVVAQRAANGLEGCQLAGELVPDTTVEMEHLPMPVNSFDSEFGGRTGPDGLLYFTALRGALGPGHEVEDTTRYRARIYTTTDTTGQWAAPLVLPVNAETGRHHANSTWSSDGQWFYFSREESPGEFSIQAMAPGAAASETVLHVPGSTVTQPMVAAINGRDMLFFTSNMPGGQGGLDIWWGQLEGAGLSNMKPLGTTVNTLGNETCPYLDISDNTLYFSSDFLPGLGGFDIFMSPMADGVPGAAVNMGLPFNSSANDLYPAIDRAVGKGWITSNRTGSFAEDNSTCCNDLYRLDWPGTEPLAEEIPLDTLESVPPTERAPKRLISLREKLPIQLYFHNDEPNPRSWDTSTTLDYAATFRSYAAKKAEYDSAWRKAPDGSRAFDHFFEQQVEGGYNQLGEFIALLSEALDEGQSYTLIIRGYASPLAKSDYNRNLSMRRIASLENHFRQVDDGRLLPYLNGAAPNGARLTIQQEPYGKSTADPSVSDRLDDLRHSVYSVGAARERRIEIEQVR